MEVKKIREHLKEKLQEIQIEIDKIDDLIYREMIYYLNRTITIEQCTNSLNRLQKCILARKHYLEQYKILKDSLNNF